VLVLVLVCAAIGAALGPAVDLAAERVPALGRTPDEVHVHRRIPGRVVVASLLTALAFAAMAHRFGAELPLVPYLVLGAALVALSLIDVEHHRLPDRLVFPTLAVAVPLVVAVSLAEGVPGAIASALVGLVAYAGIMLVFACISPAGMGMGDVKLGLVLGLFLGWLDLYLVLVGLLLGSLLGAVLSVGVLAVTRDRKAGFPYGPCLCVGALAAIALSGQLL
jgi:leader peptidase (prepilin peptidase)/N-methyltransferase